MLIRTSRCPSYQSAWSHQQKDSTAVHFQNGPQRKGPYDIKCLINNTMVNHRPIKQTNKVKAEKIKASLIWHDPGYIWHDQSWHDPGCSSSTMHSLTYVRTYACTTQRTFVPTVRLRLRHTLRYVTYVHTYVFMYIRAWATS